MSVKSGGILRYMKRVIVIILFVSILAVSGIYFFSKLRTKPTQLAPTQDVSSGGNVFPLLGTSVLVDKVKGAETSPSLIDSISVGSVNTNTTVTNSQKKEPTSVAPETQQTPGTQSCGVSQLRFSISVPVAWKCSLEERSGNALAFYIDSKEIGSIEVFLGTNQGYDSLKQEIFANPENSLVVEKSMFSMKVFSFESLKYGKSVAFVYRNNTYYFRNNLIDRGEEFTFKLF